MCRCVSRGGIDLCVYVRGGGGAQCTPCSFHVRCWVIAKLVSTSRGYMIGLGCTFLLFVLFLRSADHNGRDHASWGWFGEGENSRNLTFEELRVSIMGLVRVC